MKHPGNGYRSRERGVVLVFTLIILLILTIGAVAMMRSTQTSMFSAGNLAFRRDLVNQGEQAVSKVMTEFKPGGPLVAVDTADVLSLNYKASTLVTNAQGVPTVLLNGTAFTGAGFPTTNDMTAGTAGEITIRYVIDRMCSAPGPSVSTLCVQSSAAPTGGTANATPGLAPPTATVYRLSISVTGPRLTQVFLQSTFTKPD